jgi:hypothetical protein|tara:strand:+ start:1018 stop:1464 length:447 start_codon:yes stop_codon:yes gene_type:complete
MERVITCPHCLDTNNCFEEIQETFSSYLCFSCGFMSDSRYEIGNLQLIENMKNSPQLVRESQFEDKDRGIIWFPSVINMGKLGMIFPEGTKDKYVWKYAKVVDIPEEERVNYDNYSQRLDVENAKTFQQNDFMGACKEMGITQRLNNA